MGHRNLLTDLTLIGDWLETEPPVTGELWSAMRVIKLQEEAGEVAEAYFGMLGANRCKGTTHTLDDVLAENADVAITAMVNIYHFTGCSEFDLRRVMRQKCDEIMLRAGLRGQ